MDEYDLKARLVGETRPLSAFGGHQPTCEQLTQPLEGDTSLLFRFCEGCGSIREVTPYGKAVFEKEFGITIPNTPVGAYLHVARCLRCDTAFRGVEVRSIPQ